MLKSEHHSISDGWSGPILLNKVHKFYQDLESGLKPKIEEDQSYLRAQKYYQDHHEEIRQHWDERLKEIDHANDINRY